MTFCSEKNASSGLLAPSSFRARDGEREREREREGGRGREGGRKRERERERERERIQRERERERDRATERQIARERERERAREREVVESLCLLKLRLRGSTRRRSGSLWRSCRRFWLAGRNTARITSDVSASESFTRQAFRMTPDLIKCLQCCHGVKTCVPQCHLLNETRNLIGDAYRKHLESRSGFLQLGSPGLTCSGLAG